MASCFKRCPALFTCLLLAGVLLAGCSDRHTIARLPDGGVILAFGDSITYGSGADREHSYPASLTRLSGHPVINAGIPGEVSAAGKQRLPALLDRHKPVLLILCHGGNDLLHRQSTAEIKANLEAMIDSARQRDIPVLLIGVPAIGLLFLESAELYREVAEAHGLLYEDEVLPRVESDPDLKADRIHPNAAGYAEIAGAVYQRLRDSGALE